MGKEMHKKLRQRGDKTQSEEATKLSSAEATVEMRKKEVPKRPTPKDKEDKAREGQCRDLCRRCCLGTETLGVEKEKRQRKKSLPKPLPKALFRYRDPGGKVKRRQRQRRMPRGSAESQASVPRPWKRRRKEALLQ